MNLKKGPGWPLAAVLSFFVLAPSSIAHPSAKRPMFQVLYNFTGGSDGYAPTSAPVADQAGNLYGTTYFGGR